MSGWVLALASRCQSHHLSRFRTKNNLSNSKYQGVQLFTDLFFHVSLAFILGMKRLAVARHANPREGISLSASPCQPPCACGVSSLGVMRAPRVCSLIFLVSQKVRTFGIAYVVL